MADGIVLSVGAGGGLTVKMVGYGRWYCLICRCWGRSDSEDGGIWQMVLSYLQVMW